VFQLLVYYLFFIYSVKIYPTQGLMRSTEFPSFPADMLDQN